MLSGPLKHAQIRRFEYSSPLLLESTDCLAAPRRMPARHSRSPKSICPGHALVRLDASFCLDSRKRTCVVDAATDVGRAIVRIFTSFLTREFGEEALKVERVGGAPAVGPELKATGPRDGSEDDHHLFDVEPVLQLPRGVRVTLHPGIGSPGTGPRKAVSGMGVSRFRFSTQ